MLSRLADLVGQRISTDAQVQAVAPAPAIAWRDFTLGELLRAHVLTALADGRFQALIEDHPVTLRLPAQAQPGDDVQLKVFATEPQLRLALAAPPGAAAGAAQLSATARFITDLLNIDEELPLTTSAASTAPVLPGAPGSSATVATALKHALVQSGMFYESHQAQWIAGERPLAELRKEPQATLPPLRGPNAATSGLMPNGLAALTGELVPNGNAPESNGPASTGARAYEAVAAESMDEAQASQLPQRSGVVTTLAGQSVDSDGMVNGTALNTSGPESPVHRDALAIVRQQLDVLDTRNVVWSGLIWPDQQLDWEIGEQPREAADTPEVREWQTRLRLVLPRLGAVAATLTLTPRGVGVTVEAAEGQAVGMLSSHRAELQEAMRTAGLAVIGITVGNNGTA